MKLNRVPTSNLRAYKNEDPLRCVHTHTDELLPQRIGAFMQAEIAPVPVETPYWNRVWHGWPLDLQMLRGFLKYF